MFRANDRLRDQYPGMSNAAIAKIQRAKSERFVDKRRRAIEIAERCVAQKYGGCNICRELVKPVGVKR